MKPCSKCGKSKPYSDYNRDKTKPDGYYSSCKPCKLLKDYAWEKKNPDKVRARQKRYYSSEKGVLAHRAMARKMRKQYPEKKLARESVRKARLRKKNPLIPPSYCQKCNEEKKLFAHHHKGYEREYWRDVAWLCQQCHVLAHR